MLKSLAAATAALVLVAASAAYAQQRVGGPDGCGAARFARHYRPSAEDIKAFADARIAALRAGLELTPDQQKNWPPFEQALRDLVKLHVARVKARQAAGGQPPSADPFARLQRRAGAMAQFSAALKRVADAGEPLYQSLNDAQKRRLKVLAHMLRPHGLAGGWWREHRWHGMMGPNSCPRGMHGMMGPDRDNGGHGMMRPDVDQR